MGDEAVPTKDLTLNKADAVEIVRLFAELKGKEVDKVPVGEPFSVVARFSAAVTSATLDGSKLEVKVGSEGRSGRRALGKEEAMPPARHFVCTATDGKATDTRALDVKIYQPLSQVRLEAVHRAVPAGKPVELRWSFFGAADSASIDNGVGELDFTKSNSGTATVTVAKLPARFTLTVKPIDGGAAQTAQCVVIDLEGCFVFDAVTRRPSVKFGMWMVKALMKWEMATPTSDAVTPAGCLYSVNAEGPPGKVEIMSGWPELQDQLLIAPLPEKGKGKSGKLYPAFDVLGMTWYAAGATNCGYSQLAAFTVSQRDAVLRFKTADTGSPADVREIDLASHESDPRLRPGKHPQPHGETLNLLFAKGAESQREFLPGAQPASYGSRTKVFGGFDEQATAWGLRYLDVGDSVCSSPKSAGKSAEDKAALLRVRIGDWGMWFAHCWTVSDLAYKVTLEFPDAGKGVKRFFLCTQSCFARGKQPALKPFGGNPTDALLSAEECTWIEQNEAEFEARIAAFLSAKELDAGGTLGKGKVVEIVLAKAQEFSANASDFEDGGFMIRTVWGHVYKSKEKKADMTPDKLNKDESWVLQPGWRGVTRIWVDLPAPPKATWGFGRAYDRAKT